MDMNFKPFKQCLSNIEYASSDFSLPENRIKDLHLLHKILNKYFESFRTTPRAWNMVDYEIFTSFIEDYDSKPIDFKNLTKKKNIDSLIKGKSEIHHTKTTRNFSIDPF